MKKLLVGFLLLACIGVSNGATVTAPNVATVDLATGRKLSVTADAGDVLVQRYNGPTLVSTTLVSASATQTFGEYFIRFQFKVIPLSGTATHSDSQSTDAITSSSSITSGSISGVTLSASTVTDTGLTSGRVPFSTTGGLLTDSSALTFSAGTLSATTFSGAFSGAATTAGTVTTAAQPSITSVGTLTGLTASGQIAGATGSAATPSYSFSADTNTGLISSAADSIGFVTGGTERWVINSSGSLNPKVNATYDIGNGSVNPRDVQTSRDVVVGRHVITGGLPTVGVSDCGTTASVAGSDNGMVVTVGSGGTATACLITFNTAWPHVPACIAESDTDILPLASVPTTTTVTINKTLAFTAGSKLSILCMGF